VAAEALSSATTPHVTLAAIPLRQLAAGGGMRGGERASVDVVSVLNAKGLMEVFIEYETPLFVANGWAYRARACGGAAHDGTDRWHGWIEFLPIEEGLPVRTARETTQPNRTCAREERHG